MTPANAVETLTEEVRELLVLLESRPAPDISDLRSRIEATLDSAQRAVERSSVRARLGRYATSIDNYVVSAFRSRG
jgi:ElaB/YqjD/DUF883 family membrane-anchored ribosome-binding protein